jgi:HEAT repeat protein
VNFDYEETWICETIFEKSKEEYLQQLTYSKDVLAKKAALDRLVEIAQDTITTPAFKDKTLTAFKHEIASPFYWRYRLYALGSLRKILPAPYDSSTISMLLQLIKTEKSWLKTSAIFTLGNTKEAKYSDVYIAALNDESDRVINAAAVALGKTKSPEAYAILINLEKKPSWKSQSRISALNGLEQLGDIRAVDFVLRCLADNQSPRWYLATPVWDYPYTAAYTLVALGKAELGFPVLFERFKKSLEDNDLNDIFQNVQLIDILKDERAKEMYALLREKFKHEVPVLEAVENYEQNFLESLKK